MSQGTVTPSAKEIDWKSRIFGGFHPPLVQGSGAAPIIDGKEARHMANLLCKSEALGPGINYTTSIGKSQRRKEGQDDSVRKEEPLPARWTLFTDGSSCVDGCGAGVILTDPEGVEFTYALRFQFETTNNEAEYEALIAGLRIAEKMGVKNLEVNVESKLVANQVNGTYIAKETDMVKYLEKVKALTNTFRAFSIKQVPRSKNKKADALSKRLRIYFQAHPITVITDQPIKNVLSNPKVAGRMQKWSIQLGEFGIHYRPRVSMKGQVLADFIMERPEEEGRTGRFRKKRRAAPGTVDLVHGRVILR
ncbi:reverse transcriptase domain-containing protein [Tanacetum coccineum]|uniref:Reverse transcriptase domain-containing protein n=1 Tax=Tanacetum coccineum TaxID=301880 RepID=A0ABQ5AUV8_9ASTR